MKEVPETYELELTWEELEEQRYANEAKENTTPPRKKKYI